MKAALARAVEKNREIKRMVLDLLDKMEGGNATKVVLKAELIKIYKEMK